MKNISDLTECKVLFYNDNNMIILIMVILDDLYLIIPELAGRNIMSILGLGKDMEKPLKSKC